MCTIGSADAFPSTHWRLSMRSLAIALLLTVVTLDPVHAAKGVGPVKLAPAASDTIMAAYEKDRSETEQHLRESPTSYLAAVARTDFGDKTTLVLGSAADCDLRVDDPDLAAHHLRVTVVGDSFRVEAPDENAPFGVGGKWVTFATVPPSTIKVGRFTVRLSHQRFPALIVFDPNS